MSDPDVPRFTRAEKERLLEQLLAERARRSATEALGEDLERQVRVESFAEYQSLNKALDEISELAQGEPLYFQVRDGVSGPTLVRGGESFSDFTGFNYLGLAGHPAVHEAAKAAIDRHGTSVSASRLASGELTLHRELEGALAAFLGTEDALVYVAGHGTNVSTIGQLVGPADAVFHDELIHNSVLDGVRLSGARAIPFSHNDPEALERLLTEHRRRARRALIAVEGVYSMDGDIARLPALIQSKERHHALLMVDEAHSLGVIGERGGGLREHFSLRPDSVDVWMGTLSKALASCGGYVAGSRSLVRYLKYRSSGFVYSVGMSPPSAGAALAALRLLEREPARVRALQQKSRLFLDRVRAAGFDTGFATGNGVVPVLIRDSARCVRLAAALSRRRVLALPVVYPVVPETGARLRFFITSEHSEAQIHDAVRAVSECARALA